MPTLLNKDEEAAVYARDIVLVAFDGAEAIDIAGPASVFSKAEQLHRGTYRLHIASIGSQAAAVSDRSTRCSARSRGSTALRREPTHL
jgi:hypothetical protein